MKFPQDVIESLLSKTRIDHKGGNLYSECPYCGGDEFGISLADNHLFRCFRGNQCGAVGNIYTLLKYLGQMELLNDSDSYKETDVFSPLERKSLSSASREKSGLPDMKSPMGWKRVTEHEYLEGRNFGEAQFGKYEIGTTTMLNKYQDYVIFLIRKNGFIKGFISRSIKDKAVIDAHNKQVKLLNKSRDRDDQLSPMPRYANSLDTDFAKILYGIDEAVKGITKTIILVEGLFDKINLEIIAPEFFKNKEVIVCCTWGKKISEEQVADIEAHNIGITILLYDPDAVNDSKKFSFFLETKVKTVLVGYHSDKDPGDLDVEEFITVLDTLESPQEFRRNKLQKRELF